MLKSDIKAFEIYKNIYFVGSSRVSVHIVRSKMGLIMLDTGYPDMYDQILNSMADLGLEPEKICAIFHTHGHIDHFGCTLKFKEISGAKTYISAIDNEITNGNRNLSWADELGYPRPEPFNCDVLINDGDVFDFSDVKIRPRLTPGHTEGVLSYFFEMEDKTVAAMHGGVGMNTLNKDYLTKNGLPLTLIDEFLKGLETLKSERVDLVLGNHPQQNSTSQKLEAVNNGKCVLDKNEWQEFLNIYKEKILNMICQEKGEQNGE